MKSSLTLITAVSYLMTCTAATTFPAKVSTGNCNAEFSSVLRNLDGPKLSCINDTVLDWWYFEAISPEQKSSVIIGFYLLTTNALPLFSNPTNVVPTVGISASFPNGTTVSFDVAADQAVITGAEEVSNGDYSGGDFEGGIACWSSTNLVDPRRASRVAYEVSIDAPSVGIKGTMRLEGVAPPHYPCTADLTAAGAGEQVAPHLGWSNMLPAATASIDFTFQGSQLYFTGIGYQDKNWSDKPFLDSVGSWGHTTLGDYSLVWFDFLTPGGDNYISSYISHQGKVLASSCDPGAIKVRPTGQNSTYPPTTTSGAPSGFEILIDMGSNGHMQVNVDFMEYDFSEDSRIWSSWSTNVAVK